MPAILRDVVDSEYRTECEVASEIVSQYKLAEIAGKRMNEIADRYVSHTGENLWTFEMVQESDVQNMKHIHPLKQRDVDRIVRAVKKDGHIQEVIVFGSAVRFDCHSGSDLDLLIVRDDDKVRIDSSLDEIESELDIIFHSRLGKRLGEEIARTGVVVYHADKGEVIS